MKPTLKSLLLTSMFTLPLTAGSEPISIGDTVLQAHAALTRNGNSTAAVEVYASYAMRPDALWFHVLFATKMIEGLGDFEKAIEVFEWSMKHPNTPYLANAKAHIDRLTQLLATPTEIPAATVEAQNAPTIPGCIQTILESEDWREIADAVQSVTSESFDDSQLNEDLCNQLMKRLSHFLSPSNSEKFFEGIDLKNRVNIINNFGIVHFNS